MQYGWIRLNWETKQALFGSEAGDWALYVRERDGVPDTVAFTRRTRASPSR